MQHRTLSCLAIVSVLALAGCNGERTPEQLIKEQTSAIQDFGGALAKVTDKASAEKQKAAVEAAIAKMDKLMKEMEALPADKQKASDALTEKPTPEMAAAMSKMMNEMSRISMDTEILSVLQPVLDKMGNR